MNKLIKYKFSDLYEMSSGLSSTKEQAGHESPFLSFSAVYHNHFVSEELKEKIDTTLQYAMVKQINVKKSHRKYIS